jgi:hypothetical protein
MRARASARLQLARISSRFPVVSSCKIKTIRKSTANAFEPSRKRKSQSREHKSESFA